MFSFSKKQTAFIEYLLERLGFQNETCDMDYLQNLTQCARYFKNFRAIFPEPGQKIDDSNPLSENFVFDGIKWIPKKYNIIDFLIDEISLKKSKSVSFKILGDDQLKVVSASDLSAFSFCPASFVIGKTIVTESTVLAERGSYLHSERNLQHRVNMKEQVDENTIAEFDSNTQRMINDENRGFFEDVKNAELLFSGHTKNSEKYFMNEKKNFIGQPDYVFKKPNGETFIVEEKFRYSKEESEHIFYLNHEIQVYSYIYGLKDFKADYGYLVYWLYDMYQGEYYVNSCQVKILFKSSETQSRLNRSFIQIRKLLSSKEMAFASQNLNSKKCGNCMVNRYCGHKSGRFNQLKFPYSLDYHKVWSAKYPDILDSNK